MAFGSWVAVVGAALAAIAAIVPANAGDAPKRGGSLTYMIPADAPPSFDGHRDGPFGGAVL
jgi:peptide/nickel transport system substrate-binding protein